MIAALWLLVGLAAGVAYFGLLRRNTMLYVTTHRVSSSLAQAIALQVLRLAAIAALLGFAARRARCRCSSPLSASWWRATWCCERMQVRAMTESPIVHAGRFPSRPRARSPDRSGTTWGIMALLGGGSLAADASPDIAPNRRAAVSNSRRRHHRPDPRHDARGPTSLSAADRHAVLFHPHRQLVVAGSGREPPTAHIETDAALALIVFVAIAFLRHSRARRDRLAGELRRAEPADGAAQSWWRSFTRTFSLLVRLFGNVMSGVFVIAIVLSLAGLFVPIPLMALEMLVRRRYRPTSSPCSRRSSSAPRSRYRTSGAEEVRWTSSKSQHSCAALAVSFGSIGPALAEGASVAAAMDAIARQPEAAGTISRTLFVGLAMIETMAIYCLVIALLLLFANPYAG